MQSLQPVKGNSLHKNTSYDHWDRPPDVAQFSP